MRFVADAVHHGEFIELDLRTFRFAVGRVLHAAVNVVVARIEYLQRRCELRDVASPS